MRESQFQAQLIKKLNKMLPGIIILKNDPNYIQGIPDLILLYKNRWAALEVKRGATASVRPNQAHYVRTMYAMSYAAFIYPENESEILNEVQQSLTA
jgi:hypothetical protein|nr:MAG TPA: Nuclease [Caudoviricetes sp.]